MKRPDPSSSSLNVMSVIRINPSARKALTRDQRAIGQGRCRILVEVIWPELINIQDQAVVLVARVLVVPDGVVVLGDVDLGVVEVPLAVGRIGDAAHHQ
jgi:hypothetical protein